MVFNLSVGFRNLKHKDEPKKLADKDKVYALLVADTVLVQVPPRSIRSGAHSLTHLHSLLKLSPYNTFAGAAAAAARPHPPLSAGQLAFGLRPQVRPVLCHNAVL